MSGPSFPDPARRMAGTGPSPVRARRADIDRMMFGIARFLMWARRHDGPAADTPCVADQKPVDSPSRKVRGRSGVISAPPAN